MDGRISHPRYQKSSNSTEKRRKTMANIMVFKNNVKRASNPIPYLIGFVNDKKMEDETELNAKDANDLAELWQSLCKELRAEENSVTYVARA